MQIASTLKEFSAMLSTADWGSRERVRYIYIPRTTDITEIAMINLKWGQLIIDPLRFRNPRVSVALMIHYDFPTSTEEYSADFVSGQNLMDVEIRARLERWCERAEQVGAPNINFMRDICRQPNGSPVTVLPMNSAGRTLSTPTSASPRSCPTSCSLGCSLLPPLSARASSVWATTTRRASS